MQYDNLYKIRSNLQSSFPRYTKRKPQSIVLVNLPLGVAHRSQQGWKCIITTESVFPVLQVRNWPWCILYGTRSPILVYLIRENSRLKLMYHGRWWSVGELGRNKLQNNQTIVSIFIINHRWLPDCTASNLQVSGPIWSYERGWPLVLSDDGNLGPSLRVLLAINLD